MKLKQELGKSIKDLSCERETAFQKMVGTTAKQTEIALNFLLSQGKNHPEVSVMALA